MNTTPYQTPPFLSTVRTPAELGRLVVRIMRAFPDIRVWLFQGELGSGKTTAIRAVLRSWGVSKRVVSPTYTLAQTYQLTSRRWALHIDAYRLRKAAEWPALGLEEALLNKWYILVEWPERMSGYRWGPHGKISLMIVPAGRVVRWKVARSGPAFFMSPAGAQLRGKGIAKRRRPRSSRRHQIRSPATGQSRASSS